MGENALGGGGMGPADVAAVMGNGNANSWGGGWARIIIVLFAFLFGNNGWNNNGFANAIGYENLATSNEVQRGFDNQNSMANQRDILAAVSSGTAQAVAATNQSFHDTYAVFSDKYYELQRDIANLAMGQANAMASQKDCCCQTLRAIDGVNYNNAMSTAQVVQAISADGEATRNMIMGNRYDDLMMKYNDLSQRMNTQELRDDIYRATAGVVRYPQGFVYNAGSNPFCGCDQMNGCCNM